MNIRYVLHPGLVRSKHDKDSHFIGRAQLLELYKLPPGTKHIVFGAGFESMIGDINLAPRGDGNYSSLPRPVDSDDLT